MILLAVGVFLSVVGVCDLLRAARDTTTGARRGLIVGVGTCLLVLLLALLGLRGLDWLVLGAGLVAAFVLWVLGSSAAIQSTGRDASVSRGLAFAGLALGGVVGLLAVGSLDPVVAWPAWAQDSILVSWPVPDVAVASGVVLTQLSTANLVVRLVLDAVGVPATSHEKQVKGGRLLGPMERILIIGLGAIGQFTAAAVIMGAKGLLRFPELQEGVRTRTDGHSDVLEYVLVGSFASWLIALAGVALIYLA